MDCEMRSAIAEEICEVPTLSELQGLWCFGQRGKNLYGDAECVPMFREAARRLRGTAKAEVPAEQAAAPAERLKRGSIVREGNSYRLLSTDVSWSTKGQVIGIMEILKAHMQVGDVLPEETIVEAMEANAVAILKTRQGGRKIFNYYKGDWNEGLTAHGNLELA